MPDKKPAAEQDNEDAPLLANDTAPDHGEEAGNTENHSGGRNLSRYLNNLRRWMVRNRLVVAILCLLLGGFIALCIYFGGKKKSCPCSVYA